MLISPAEMAEYKRTARERWQAEQREAAARRERAWQLAREAAALLKHDFGVTRVVLFGSLSHLSAMSRRSICAQSVCRNSCRVYARPST
jgi:hypothetical protein